MSEFWGSYTVFCKLIHCNTIQYLLVPSQFLSWKTFSPKIYKIKVDTSSVWIHFFCHLVECFSFYEYHIIPLVKRWCVSWFIMSILMAQSRHNIMVYQDLIYFLQNEQCCRLKNSFKKYFQSGLLSDYITNTTLFKVSTATLNAHKNEAWICCSLIWVQHLIQSTTPVWKTI